MDENILNNQINHLSLLREDVRNEIKNRIEHRNKYSMQLTIGLGAIFSISLSNKGFQEAIIVIPLISIYFTILILYSYRVHKILTKYLREEIEPELAKLCELSVEKELETFYKNNAIPGIRKTFYISSLWVINFISLFYLWILESIDKKFEIILIITTIIYIITTIVITNAFWND